MTDMSKREKVRLVRKLCGVTTHLSWARLCELTEFDSFGTMFAFGFNWNKNSQDDRLVTMTEPYLNMIIFNVTSFPKVAKQ